jgi:hypothetical protein
LGDGRQKHSKRIEGIKVGFYSGLVGLDRIALSRFLQAHRKRRGANRGPARGWIDAGVSEALIAPPNRRNGGRAGGLACAITWALSGRIRVVERHLTLKRLPIDVINTLDCEGFLRKLARKYRIVPIEMALGGA